MRQLNLVLHVISFLIVAAYVVLPLASWIDNWVTGEPIEIHWTFWAAIGMFFMLQVIREVIVRRYNLKKKPSSAEGKLQEGGRK